MINLICFVFLNWDIEFFGIVFFFLCLFINLGVNLFENLDFLNDEIFFLWIVNEVLFNNLFILIVLGKVWLLNKLMIINELGINVIILNIIIFIS